MSGACEQVSKINGNVIMFNKETVERIRHGRLYQQLQLRAERLASSPRRLEKLTQNAMEKFLHKPTAALAKLRTAFQASTRLLKAYAKGEYRAIPKQSLIALIAAMAYFVIPTDLIPDFIATLGFFDDVALLGWVFQSIREDLTLFEAWEQSQTVSTAPPLVSTEPSDQLKD